MADEATLMWTRIRERRRSLRDGPLLKVSNPRLDSLSAGLTQFEEQMTAAGAVSSVTRPINLYYALEQAGLAITATRAQGEYWFSSHGLKIVDLDADLCEMKVRIDGKQTRGAYGIVSNTIGSELIGSEVSVGALWASLPDLAFIPLPGTEYPEVIPIMPDMPYTPSPGSSVIDTLFRPTSASIFIDRRYTPTDATDAWLKEVLKPYPGIESCTLYTDQYARTIEPGLARLQVKIAWPYPGRNLTKDETREFFDALAPAYRYVRDRYLRPSIEEHGKRPPSPLMTWWLLLYVFSMISRYRPGKWTKLLDLDRSGYAAPLQYALQEAISVLPHLVLEALDNASWLLPKPMLITDA